MLSQRLFAALTPTLDGDILTVLARANEEFTAARSPSHAVYYRLIRSRLLTRAVLAGAQAREAFLERLRAELAAWSQPQRSAPRRPGR